MKTPILFISIFLFCYCTNLSAQTNYRYFGGIAEGIDSEYEKIPEKATLTRSFYTDTPPKHSLKQFAPSPQHQGNYNTGTGWAIAYAARTILEAQKNGWTNQELIDQHAFSPTFQYRLSEPSSLQCEDGAYPSEVVRSLKDIGALPISEFGISGGKTDCPTAPISAHYEAQAAAHKIEAFARLWTSNDSDAQMKIERTQKSLSEGNPVIISMECPPSFDDIGADGLWKVTENVDSWRYGADLRRHSLCVVGYDKDRFRGAFEVQNSWGTDWGQGGYAWISFADFAQFTFQAFELVQLPKSLDNAPYLAGSLKLYDMDERENMKVTWQANAQNPELPAVYRVESPLRSGSKMRMYLKSEQPAFVYLLGTGSVNQSVNTLFPFEGFSAAMNYSTYEVALPSEDHYFEMDATVGKDYIIVLYAKEALEIEDIRQKIATESATLSLSKRIDKALSVNRIEAQRIDFAAEDIAFEVEKGDERAKVFVVVIEFEHE